MKPRCTAVLMRGTSLLCAVAMWLAAAPAGAQSLEPGGLKSIGVATGLKPERGGSATDGFPDWKVSYRLAAREFVSRGAPYGDVRESRRFGLDDFDAHAGFYPPPGAIWNPTAEGRANPVPDVLSRYSVYGQVLKILPGGWGVGLGLRHNEYSPARSNVASLEAERHWGNFRGAYTLYPGRSEGAATAAGHRLQFGYFYADRSSVSLSYSTGREVEYVGPTRGVIAADAQNWTLSGRHWLTPAWTLTYDLTAHEQGTLYRRQGLRLGIRHSF